MEDLQIWGDPMNHWVFSNTICIFKYKGYWRNFDLANGEVFADIDKNLR